MKKYILMLGVAGVALGSYCAMASNSATMTVTATIAHDVSLSVTQDIDMGTITVNPAVTDNTKWSYNETGELYNTDGIGIISADNVTAGIFSANIANPSACNKAYRECGGLSVTGNTVFEGRTWSSISNLFGENNDNGCDFFIQYSGTENTFKVFPYSCGATMSTTTIGSHSGTLTISYNPE
ncbi:MAG: hypothetical protein IJ689_01505 [Alphaproteobacteria bacterium]|nr:hypothetical protein [Alphaproteobacteria bacterium]